MAVLDFEPDYAALGSRPLAEQVDLHDPSMWRFRSLLPVSLGDDLRGTALGTVGGTPLYRVQNPLPGLGLPELVVKDESRGLTGSLKDRASAAVVARAVELGETTVTTASSGNAAVALAGCCAAAGLRCVVFVPRSTPEGKLRRLHRFAATVLQVNGSYDETVAVAYQASQEWGWYCRSTGYNPFTGEGKKTVALEIVQQLGWCAPDALVLPVGDGNIMAGVHRGLQDALAMRWIDRMPRLYAVQADRAAPLLRSWRWGRRDVEPVVARSEAASINVGAPQDGFRALRAVRETGGSVVAVSDDLAVRAAAAIASRGGPLMELSSAVAVAALPTLLNDGSISRTDRVVVVNTGSGVDEQTPGAAQNAIVVEPSISSVADGLASERRIEA